MKLLMIWNDLLNLIYPNLCAICQTPLVEGEKHLCLHCLCDLPRVSVSGHSVNDPVDYLLLPPDNKGSISAFLIYEKGGGVQKLVHRLKYYGDNNLAWQLGRQAAFELSRGGNALSDIDILLPVPLHWTRKWKRGYNQSEWIARGMQSVLGKSIDLDSLKKRGRTVSQTKMTVYGRSQNVLGMYELKIKDSLSGKHILLIDDVMTTGSTISSCVKALSEVPNIKISVFALATV